MARRKSCGTSGPDRAVEPRWRWVVPCAVASALLAVAALAARPSRSEAARRDTVAGDRALDAGRPEEAELRFRRALARLPQDPRAWCGLGRSLAATGREPEAADALRRAARGAPDWPEPRLDLAALLLDVGLPEDGLETLCPVLARQDPPLAALRLRARLNRHAGALDAALDDLRTLARRGPGDVGARVAAGLLALRIGVEGASPDHLREGRELLFSAFSALRHPPQDGQCMDERAVLEAVALIAMGEHREALAVLDRVRQERASGATREQASRLRAVALAADGRYDEALRVLERGAASFPSPSASLALARMRLVRGDVPGAERAASTALRLGGRDPRIARVVASCALRRGDVARAREVLDALPGVLQGTVAPLCVPEGASEGARRLALTAATGRLLTARALGIGWREAADCLDAEAARLLLEDPGDEAAQAARWAVRLVEGDAKRVAKTLADEASAPDPSTPVRRLRAAALARVGFWRDAWAEYRALAQRGELEPVVLEHARIASHAEDGGPRGALALAVVSGAADRLDPSLGAGLDLARALALRGDPRAALRVAQPVLAVRPRSEAARFTAAEILLREGAAAEVEGLCEGIDDPASAFLRGCAAEARGDVHAAAACYRTALSHDPDFAVAANNLAWLVCTAFDDPAAALPIARRARDLLPGDPRVADTLGEVLRRSGDPRAAVRHLRRAAEGLPSHGGVALRHALALLAVGEEADARAEARRAAVLTPSLAATPAFTPFAELDPRRSP